MTPPNGAEDQHYLALDPPYRAANRRIADLAELARVKGFDARAVARLEPFVTALPDETPVNVNTAPAAVLRALVPGLGPEDATRLVRARAASGRSRAGTSSCARCPTRPAASIDAQIDVQAAASSAPRRRCASVGSRPAIARSSSGRSATSAACRRSSR